MTHAELDQIAARAIFTTDLLGKGGLQNYVALSESERDALLTLAREGLAARDNEAEYACTICGSTWVATRHNWHRHTCGAEVLALACKGCGFIGRHAKACVLGKNEVQA